LKAKEGYPCPKINTLMNLIEPFLDHG